LEADQDDNDVDKKVDNAHISKTAFIFYQNLDQQSLESEKTINAIFVCPDQMYILWTPPLYCAV